MKSLVALFVFGSLNSWALPCGGAQVAYWTNPDESQGGSVEKTAKVESGVFIAKGAQVCKFAQVKSGAQILDQASIGGNALIEGSAKVTGSSHVHARSKVKGRATIHNSKVCQASVIENIIVSESDYYCQTEDPEPPHPGEAGKATLLGVDSDQDGVRDDVEIWINDTYSNAPDKDMYNYRMGLKAYAKAASDKMKYRSDVSKVKAAIGEMSDALLCLRFERKKQAKSLEEKLKISSEIKTINTTLRAELNNTPARILEDLKTRTLSHGESVGPSGKTLNGCNFDFRK